MDIIADKEDETQAKDAPDLPCVGQVKHCCVLFCTLNNLALVL